jgi:heat shock protein HslJ
VKASRLACSALALAIAVVAGSLVGCTPTAPAAPKTPLTGTKWMVVSYDGGNGLVPLLKDTTITADFGDTGMLTGDATVNQYTAAYTMKGQSISVAQPSATRKAGSADQMAQEAAYLKALQSAASWRVLGNALDLYAASGVGVVSLRARQ